MAGAPADGPGFTCVWLLCAGQTYSAISIRRRALADIEATRLASVPAFVAQRSSVERVGGISNRVGVVYFVWALEQTSTLVRSNRWYCVALLYSHNSRLKQIIARRLRAGNVCVVSAFLSTASVIL